jgi:hypothetical protein
MLFSFFFFSLLHASEVQYVRTAYNFKAGSPEEKLLKRCAEIPYSYVAELEGFRGVSREIQTLLHGPDYFARAGELKALSEKLRMHSERLNELAKPEWNTENHFIDLSWALPAAEFFPPPGQDDRGFRVNYGGLKEQTINRITLMGKERDDLKQPKWAAYFSVRPKYLFVRIDKPATLLEFCQLIRTVEVDYTVRYYTTPFKPYSDLRLDFEKNFKLIFEEI